MCFQKYGFQLGTPKYSNIVNKLKNHLKAQQLSKDHFHLSILIKRIPSPPRNWRKQTLFFFLKIDSLLKRKIIRNQHYQRVSEFQLEFRKQSFLKCHTHILIDTNLQKLPLFQNLGNRGRSSTVALCLALYLSMPFELYPSSPADLFSEINNLSENL